MIGAIGAAFVAMPVLSVAAVSGVSALVGFALFPLVYKVSQIAISMFKSIVDQIKERTFFIRMRSMTCAECAKNHKQHMSPNKLFSPVELEKEVLSPKVEFGDEYRE